METVLLLGSGAIQIGQAGEFDYSGTQAIKALKEEGLAVLLVNPNVASVQTGADGSASAADEVFFVPVTADHVEAIIRERRPQGILLSFGGQSALNVGVELHRRGVLRRHGVRVLGTPLEAIIAAEDRDVFRSRIIAMGESLARSASASSVEEAESVAARIGYPVLVRAAFALGGQGSGFARDARALRELVSRALAVSPQVLVDESLRGWKEVEYEVVRDVEGNTITVCNMENFDPVGVHTGDSIVVAPSQTLSDADYHRLREASIRIIGDLGIVGECNIQFGIDPDSDRYIVIEVNPRLSRSSALASKATGYPLAYVGAKLALGATIPSLRNAVTRTTPAFFEPSLDYVVVKMPRFDFAQFGLPRGRRSRLGSAMQSIGEVLAIGRSFGEAMQKAMRMLDPTVPGFEPPWSARESLVDAASVDAASVDAASVGSLELSEHSGDDAGAPTHIARCASSRAGAAPPLLAPLERGSAAERALEAAVSTPSEGRLLAVWEAFARGWTVERVSGLSRVTPWFLRRLREAQAAGAALCGETLEALRSAAPGSRPAAALRLAKEQGFSDAQIAVRLRPPVAAAEVRAARIRLGIVPVVKQIDTVAGEHPASTNYLYLPDNGSEHDVPFPPPPVQQPWPEPGPGGGAGLARPPGGARAAMVIGSGVYHIGSSVEFDSSTVGCARTLRARGFHVSMLNSNPETVSTDYDESERLYFDEAGDVERVQDVYDLEAPTGVVLGMGGQNANSMVRALEAAGCRVLGTPVASIAVAEDRARHSRLLDGLGIGQPAWAEAPDEAAAVAFARIEGFPVLVRPSGVLGGASMGVARSEAEVASLLATARGGSRDAGGGLPSVVSKFYAGAREVDVDAVAAGGRLVAWAVSEHLEFAGTHSGDASMVYPSDALAPGLKRALRDVVAKIARALHIQGPCNIQALVPATPVPATPVPATPGDEDETAETAAEPGPPDAGTLRVIETNVRASRSMPFVSKVSGIDFASVAARAAVGPDQGGLDEATGARLLRLCDLLEGLGGAEDGGAENAPEPWHGGGSSAVVGVKVPQFSFARVGGADPLTGVNMRSTGEAAAFGRGRRAAYLTAMASVGVVPPPPGPESTVALLAGREPAATARAAVALARRLGYALVRVAAPGGAPRADADPAPATAERADGDPAHSPMPSMSPAAAVEAVRSGAVDMVWDFERSAEGRAVRRSAIDYHVPLLTNERHAFLMASALVDAGSTVPAAATEVVPHATWTAELRRERGLGPDDEAFLRTLRAGTGA
jgi:carbamoylphosphate synthase large subunit